MRMKKGFERIHIPQTGCNETEEVIQFVKRRPGSRIKDHTSKSEKL